MNLMYPAKNCWTDITYNNQTWQMGAQHAHTHVDSVYANSYSHAMLML